ncbi:serine hydrolase [Cyclobacterium jeungdonense]|uniref:Serine hydrolase n=1 Tax=Cyclobacterium jeungdonense TaxID=708087 RepID=A0ABT8CCE9_9BACT|nr:serine hydrolase [Cyclobacterium jeungdonense]MDN3689356.1 serine hydrolase [Cyclobacterium jeungdonense]
MKLLKQEMLDKIVVQTAKNKNVHGSVFHIESVDKVMSLFSASGNISQESQYYIASINKLIISFITLRLYHDKIINLDDKLSNYLPSEILNGLLVYNDKDYASDLTIRHLISHTSGLPCYLIGKWNTQQERIKFKSRSVFSWIWRILLGNSLYFIFYAIAGLTLQAVYPEFMVFYKDKIPPFDLIIGTQFIRGFIFVGIAILILKTLRLSLIKKAILIGLMFSIFGGIAPLIPPNELMPGYVRLGHGFEVGISNFLYGLVLGYLLRQKIINEEITVGNN